MFYFINGCFNRAPYQNWDENQLSALLPASDGTLSIAQAIIIYNVDALVDSQSQ